jgi:ppGpp synthetase/RelA/SpoT-type nucleotidyltranferase
VLRRRGILFPEDSIEDFRWQVSPNLVFVGFGLFRGILVDLIDQFILRYTKEYDFYNQSAQLAQQKLEATLRAAGVRSIVTARAKSIARLEDKCRQRVAAKQPYESVDEIYDDIVDLAGVRVALYFPGETDQVDGIISGLFRVLLKKRFPDATKINAIKRFSGYKATHYRVQLKEDALNDGEKRYAAARIEIQVASVLMHAWAEVEHDLVYKPLAGSLSTDEYSVLDLLNGLVMSGEIALEQLQKAGEARVAASDRKIANHYELATLLLSAGEGLTDEPISESGLGRVDHLFTVIHNLGIDTPEMLRPYMEGLHENLELRPLADQIIDALLFEDSSRYEIYNAIRAQRPWASPKIESEDEVYRYIGMFMKCWMELESLVRDATPPQKVNRPFIPTTRQLLNMNLLTEDTAYDYDQLRRMRNLLVHGMELPSVADLDEATKRLRVILADIKQRLYEQRKDGEETP